jgi:ParB-like nuclease domain
MDTGNDKADGVRPGTLASLLQSVDRKHHATPNPVRQARGQLQQGNRRIEFVPVAGLTACKSNARTHSPKQLRQIAASIKRFGFTVPVLVNAQNQILAGHGRVEAAKLNGLTQVPVLRLNHLSAAEQRAYVIADNRLAELAQWDRETLAIELNALIELDFDIAVVGFELGEIDLSIVGTDEVGEDHNAAKNSAAVAKETHGPAVCQKGDVWMLGAHKLICGEASDHREYAAIDGAIRRWQTLTDNAATLCGCGQTFNALKQQRRKKRLARAGSGRAAATDVRAA